MNLLDIETNSNAPYDPSLSTSQGVCAESFIVGVTTEYKEAIASEYPPLKDQLDKIYHSGVDAWKADIKAIKDKYPKTQVGVTTVAAVPSWVQTEVDKLNS